MTQTASELNAGVKNALQSLGRGFVGHPQNVELRESLGSGRLSLHSFHGELVRVVYRLIFLFIAESRTVDGVPILHPRGDSVGGRLARARYRDLFSVSRLRDLASKTHAGRQADLWHQFNLLVGALSGDDRFDVERRQLALPVFGSFLWSQSGTANLNAPSHAGKTTCELSNADFLDAIWSLAYTGEGEKAQPIDYQSLGSKELGGIYESLLALTPQISVDGTRFTLTEFCTNERKITGSFYTPDSLVQSLLDSALNPVVADAVKGKGGADAESAILGLRVCDPACGSGNFLVGAARRLAGHLAHARARTQGVNEPSPMMFQHALREVIQRCVYGVDLNPMAVALCKVSLWMESMEPGKPLTFLDRHIKCGNSLLGTTPRLMVAGIPDGAFVPLIGDDKRVAAYYKKRNMKERKHSVTGHIEHSEPVHRDAKPKQARQPGSFSTNIVDAEGVRTTFHQHENSRLLADAWCAAFVWRKHDIDAEGALPGFPGHWDAITDRIYREIEQRPHSIPVWMKDEINRLADEHDFFHWHLEFPEVFGGLNTTTVAAPSHAPRSSTRVPLPRSIDSTSGFDVVVGNPPFLNQLESQTATLRGLSALIRTRSDGCVRGFTDLSATFLVLSIGITREGGRVAMVQPQSLLAAADAAPVRRALLDGAALESLWVSNEHAFEGVSVYTCAPTLHKGGARRGLLRRSTTCRFIPLPTIDLDNDALAREETWSHLNAAASGVPEFDLCSAGALGDVAEATADFRDQYYGLGGFLVEDGALNATQRADFSAFPPIVTTGLIDLARCHWGTAACTILKANWRAPRIDRRRMEASGTLGPWLTSRLVPKLLLATQTRVIEVFADEDAQFVPSVPVLTVTPNDPELLWKLAAALSSPVISAIAMRKYAGAALNVHAIKLSAKQVMRLPLPHESGDWDRAAQEFRRATAATENSTRLAALRAMAEAMVLAYRVPNEQREALLAWWWARLSGTSRSARAGRMVPNGRHSPALSGDHAPADQSGL